MIRWLDKFINKTKEVIIIKIKKEKKTFSSKIFSDKDTDYTKV